MVTEPLLDFLEARKLEKMFPKRNLKYPDIVVSVEGQPEHLTNNFGALPCCFKSCHAC